MPEQLPKKIANEPPAVRLVYIALQENVHDQESLENATGLSKRRIRDVANNLVENGFAKSYRNPNDQRQRIYFDPEVYDLTKAQKTYAGYNS